MLNIGLIPLDDRPCNLILPRELASIANIRIHIPPKNILGWFTKAADPGHIIKWLRDNASEFDGLIVSIDMIAYGGLINSRLPNTTLNNAKKNINILKIIKKKFPKLSIYASSIIMRLTSSVTSDQQLEYWKLLFKYSTLVKDFSKNNMPGSKKEILKLKEKIPKSLLMDYMKSRQRNHEINKYCLELLKEGTINYLLIGQEDAAKQGLHKNEQRILMELINKNKLSDKSTLLCGADELNLLLLAKLACNIYNLYPKISATFSTKNGPNITPLYEDRPIIENLYEQIYSIGNCFASSFDSSDIIILINTPKNIQRDLLLGNKPASTTNYKALFSVLKKYQSKNIIGLADALFANGGDLRLFNDLYKTKLYNKLNAYAGWNTSANSIGTVLSNTILSFIAMKKNLKTINKQRKILYHNFLDDIFYQAKTRLLLNNKLKKQNISIWDLQENYKQTQIMLKYLFIKNIPIFLRKQISKIDIKLPWPRTFEAVIDFNIKS